MKNFLLIGLPGSGKTYFGRQLARKLSKEFVDLDQLIVLKEGRTIGEIFESVGEKGFRAIESQLLKSLKASENKIIATGGGIILKEENRLALNNLGLTVFLDRKPEEILSDVSLMDRPLLKDDPERLKTLYEDRLPLYKECADFILDANGQREMVEENLEAIYRLRDKELKLGVIGDPIDHSLSPPIHKNILKGLVKKIEYERIRIEKTGLKTSFEEGKLKLDGFNVTMPHKADIISFLDSLDPRAKELNSVNTVVAQNGLLRGFSTDGDGIEMAIKNMGKSFKSSHVMILGTGGASSVAIALAKERGAKKVEVFSRNPKNRSQMDCLSYDDLLSREENGDILINASPLGMEGIVDIFGDYGFLDKMGKDSVVLDMVYHPPKTRLIKEAENRNIKAKNGLDMLIGQAISADNKFLDIEARAQLGIEKAYRRAKSDSSY